MTEIKMPVWAMIVIVGALVLLLVYVTMGNQIWGFIRLQGKAILIGLNDLVSGRPPWLTG
jgi:hypothetical protein